MQNYSIKNTSVGPLQIIYIGNLITRIHIVMEGEEIPAGVDTEVTENAFKQLEEYFAGERTEFDLPIKASGTEFQERVWAELEKIPYGQTCTYKDIAEAIGNPKASRAVGLANNRNPLPIVVPCHRVVGSSGKLVGYAGGLEMKSRLLEIESQKLL